MYGEEISMSGEINAIEGIALVIKKVGARARGLVVLTPL